MTDIVERLREHRTMSQFQHVSDLIARLNNERDDAADEIERLRKALERKQRPEAETIDGVIAWIKEDAERLAKTRAALGEKE